MSRILLFFAFTLFVFNIQAQNKSVKKSARTFNETVSQAKMAKTNYVQKLSKLIDSQANVDSLVNDYYAHWSKSRTETSFPKKVKIKEIQKLSKDKATVTIHCTWLDISLGTFLYISESTWVRKQGKWYRSGIPEKLISSKKLN